MIDIFAPERAGSPPPMRGKGCIPSLQFRSTGITPAYAGKSESSLRKAVGVQDHPRLCGEKGRLFPLGSLLVGSPPPMRGKVKSGFSAFEFYGITPAYAGKSSRRCLPLDRLMGSPPPMRGKVQFWCISMQQNRITPAYAGKRVQHIIYRLRKRDHPRLCGEKTKKIPKQRYFFHQLASFSFSLQYT